MEGRIRQLIALYAESAKHIEAELELPVLTDFKRFRYEKQLRKIKAILKGLDAELTDITDGVVQEAYQQGIDIAAEALRKQGIEADGELISMTTQIHTSAVQAVADQMAQDLLEANGSIGRGARRILRATQQKALEDRAISRGIAEGVIEGETRREVSKRLAEQLREALGDTQTHVVAGGKRFAPEYYAELVARTRTREAVTEGALQTSVAAGVTLMQVSVHEGACEACQAFQGRVYSVTGTDPRFPALVERPPYHPNCAHVLLPWVVEGFEDDEIDRYSRMSQGDGVIQDWEDFDRVLAGGEPRTTPREWGDSDRAAKRAARKAKRDAEAEADALMERGMSA